MAFKPVVSSTAARPKQEALRQKRAAIRALSQQFELTTILLVGGLVQGTLLLLIPRIWVVLPTLIILLSRFGKTMAITFKLIPNPQMNGAILNRATAVIPDLNGEMNKDNAATEKIAVLILGMRINHPLGFFSPHMKQIGAFQRKMSEDLDQDAPNNGFLGQSFWTSQSNEGSTDVMLISYWRDIADVLRFSVGPTHRAAWSYWESNAPDLKHVGISHEVFQADRSMYESVYLNFQPTRLGATSFLRKGDELVGGTVADTWISPLVDASRGKLRNSRGRMGWANEAEREKMFENEKYGGY